MISDVAISQQNMNDKKELLLRAHACQNHDVIIFVNIGINIFVKLYYNNRSMHYSIYLT